MVNGPQDPLFDITKCPVPFVQRIPQREIIENCDIPGPPDPIFDCADAVVNIPPPTVSPIAVCPQIQTEVTVQGAQFSVNVIEEESLPCVFKFEYELTVPQVTQGPQGPSGPQGASGAEGPQGPQGGSGCGSSTQITVVTAFRVDGLNLQIKTQDVTVCDATAESDWTTVHTGEECD